MFRLRINRKFIVHAIACLAVVASGAAAAQQGAVRIGTSSPGSGFYALGVGISRLLTQHAGLNGAVEPLGGSTATMFGLGAGKVEFALTNWVAAYAAYHANPPYKKPIDFGLVAQGARSYRQILVRASAGIETPADLAGKTLVGKRPGLVEIGQITDALIKVYKLKNVRVVATTTTGEAVKALQSRTVDAAILPGGKGAGLLRSLVHDGSIRFLDIPEDKVKAMEAYLPKSVAPGVLPAGTYEHQTQAVHAFYVGTGLVASSKLSDDTVYRATKAFFENIDEFHTVDSEAKAWTLKDTLEDAPLPFHPGAIRYFKEKGLWTPVLDKQQAELRKR